MRRQRDATGRIHVCFAPITTKRRIAEEWRDVPQPDLFTSKLHPYWITSFVRSSYCTGTGRSNLGLKNRLPRAAKMIGVKPITAA